MCNTYIEKRQHNFMLFKIIVQWDCSDHRLAAVGMIRATRMVLLHWTITRSVNCNKEKEEEKERERERERVIITL